MAWQLGARRDGRRGAGEADPEADLAAAERHGVRLVVPESTEWPHFALRPPRNRRCALAAAHAERRFRRSESGEPVPPLALWAARPGRPDRARACARSESSARAPRPATATHVTAELGYGLAARGVVVVSGGAYGIDAAAHRAALAADGTTVLVSAGGLDRPYPPGNATLFEQVAADRAAGLGEPAGLRAATAPLPDPQPADRGVLDGRGRGRGVDTLRRDEHGRARPHARAGR